jgi:hypothetical protein
LAVFLFSVEGGGSVGDRRGDRRLGLVVEWPLGVVDQGANVRCGLAFGVVGFWVPPLGVCVPECEDFVRDWSLLRNRAKKDQRGDLTSEMPCLIGKNRIQARSFRDSLGADF